MRSLFALTCLCAIVGFTLVSSPAVNAAVTVQNGNTIILHNGPGNGPGGSWKVENVTLAPGNTDLFRTFCLEKNESLGTGIPYYVTIETVAIYGGNGVADIGGAGSAGVLGVSDPLSPLTAWLYQHRSSLAGYSAANDAANDALQNAIWYIENEEATLNSALALSFYNAAVAAAPTTIGDIVVMNLWKSQAEAYTKEGRIQSLLAPIPEPTTIAVWSLLATLGFVGYRMKSSKK